MPLFAATILLSSFLLFLVQPIIAKQILPWFGGTSAVWTVCLVFFQLVLLGGYTYAHLVSRVSARRQAMLHSTLLVASLLFLPIVPSVVFKPEGDTDAALRILLLLTATIGLPYFLLSTTGPLVQKWVAGRFAQQSVYRLFALSNFGSLVGLLAFPFAIEPFATSSTQSMVWSGAYALFVVLCVGAAWKAVRWGVGGGGEILRRSAAQDDERAAAQDDERAAAPARAPGVRDYALWLAFSALGSVLLLASTSHITQNIASVPFLWVLPLSLYLFSFVLAFEGRGGRGWYEQKWLLAPTLLLLVAMAAGLSAQRGVLDVNVAVPLYVFGMFVASLFCNGELAHHKPAPRWLTHFYLSISAGGALGGLFVGLVAPRVFDTYLEMPLALVALAGLAVLVVRDRRWLLGPALVALVATAWFGWSYREFLRHDVVFAQRNFYGTLRVREQGTGDEQVRRLLHGVILHGEEFTQGERHARPGTYYSPTSGVGRAIEARQAQGAVRVGVIGLGTGTLAAYGRVGDTFRFYELDPDVVTLAQRHFDYLAASPAQHEFAIGDARLSLERELARAAPGRFDVLAVDAFSSDSIPVHLLTREAVALYLQHLAPHGVLAVHISNRFLDLKPVLANIAAALGLQVRLVSDAPDEASGASSTDWVLLARAATDFDAPQLAAVVQPLVPHPEQSLWTDQFNNLLDVLKTSPFDALRRLADH